MIRINPVKKIVLWGGFFHGSCLWKIGQKVRALSETHGYKCIRQLIPGILNLGLIVSLGLLFARHGMKQLEADVPHPGRITLMTGGCKKKIKLPGV